MAEKLKLKAEKRKLLGKKIKRLRRQGILPANIYGKKIKSQAVQVSLDEFEGVFKAAGETKVIDLQINGEKKAVLIHNLQLDPVTGKPLHADFLQVDLKEKVIAEVPIELVGESPAEKQGLGTVVLQLSGIEVEALPTDLPEKFDIDLSSLTEVDQAVLVKDLEVDQEKVKILANDEEIVVKVEPPQKEEEAKPEAEKVEPEEAVEGEEKEEEKEKEVKGNQEQGEKEKGQAEQTSNN